MHYCAGPFRFLPPRALRRFEKLGLQECSGDRERRVITRLEHDAHGANPCHRHQPQGGAKALYERVYCACGETEHRIKEAQLDLFGRRASCHIFRANQLRLLRAAFAYTPMINLRRLALAYTELACTCTATIRVKLLKINGHKEAG